MLRTLRVFCSGAAGVVLLAFSVAPQAQAIERVTQVSAATTKRAFATEGGNLAGQSASLPRGRYCRAEHGASFRLWWTEEPSSAQRSSPGDANCATVPAEVGIVASQLDSAQAAAVAFGMRPATGDGPRPIGVRGWPTGGDGRYDVVLTGGQGASGESGLNACRSGLASRRGAALRYSTYMRVFTGAAKSEQQLRATTAHEYYHGLQCTSIKATKLERKGRYLREVAPPTTLMEATAEWFGNATYPQGQVGEAVGTQQFYFGRGSQLCSVPTNLLASDVQGKYTAATLLLGGFGASRAAADAVRRGLTRTRTSNPYVSPRDALVKAYGKQLLANGLLAAVNRSCSQRLAITADLALVAGTPAPQRPPSAELRLTPGAGPQSATVTVGPLSTAVIVAVGGPPPVDPTTGTYTRGATTSFSIEAAPSAPAALAAYTSGIAGAASTGFDAANRATLPYADSGIAVVVVGNPSATASLTAAVSVTAN